VVAINKAPALAGAKVINLQGFAHHKQNIEIFDFDLQLYQKTRSLSRVADFKFVYIFWLI
jgi:hypothetical protein